MRLNHHLSIRPFALAATVTMIAMSLMLVSAGPAHAEGATTIRIPLGLEPFDTCAPAMTGGGPGENVLLTGTFNIVQHSFTDAAGGFHDHIQFSLSDAKGVGLTTGISYIMTETVPSFQDVSGQSEAGVISAVVSFNLIAQGSVPNQRVEEHLHITFDAQGNVTSFTSSISTTCHG
jgi:hypothetical protein